MVSMQFPDTGPGRGGPGVSARLVGCPECELPAEITERFWLDSTDGPVLHVCVSCVDGHYFRMPADGLPAAVQPAPESPGAGAPDTVRADTVHPGTGDQSVPASSVGFARLPGRFGTVANFVSDGIRAEGTTATLA